MRVAVEGTSAAPGGGLSFLRGALRSLGERRDLQIDVFVQPALADECFGPRVRTLVGATFRGMAHRMLWVQCVFPNLVAGYDAVFAPGNLAPLMAANRTVLFVQNAHVVPQTQWTAESRCPKRRLQRLMARMSIRRSARVLFISRALKAWAEPYWRGTARVPRVLYPGVPLMPVAVTPLPRQRDVLMVGNLVPHKRIHVGVGAFAALVRRDGEVGRLRIAGGEPTPELACVLRADAERKGVRDRLDFLGFLAPDALAQAYAESGCYLSTSALEALPLPPLEAMAAGTPVVVPDSPPFREVCGAAGRYTSDDEQAIAAAISETLSSLRDHGELERVTRERASEFSWARFAHHLTSTLSEVAAA